MTSLFRGKGEEMSTTDLAPGSKIDLVGKVKKDTFNGGWYFEGMEIV